MFKVLKPFRDKTRKNKKYTKGDSYSHKDEGRIAFLLEKGFIKKENKLKNFFKGEF